MRRGVAGVLRTFRPRGDDFSVHKRKALKCLRAMDDVIILPADKGNCTVVLDKPFCEDKLQCLIQDGPYTSYDGEVSPRAAFP